ncbi:MAG: FtsX-like permease family protein [Coriobacteriia bacterium]|nr:FtsX-like permease family protein [Coriobacteriia bacterium]
MIQFRLAWRYLRGRGLRTLLTTLAVVLAVMLIFGMNGVLPSMIEAFKAATLSSAGQVDLSVTSDTSGTFGLDIYHEIARVAGVEGSTPSLRRLAAIPPKPGTVSQPTDVTAVTVIGVDPASVSTVRSFPLAAGRFLSGSDGDAVIMAEDLAIRLGLHVGSEFVLPSSVGTQHFLVIGLTSTRSVPGQDEVYVPLAAAQRLFALPDRINSVDVAYAKGADRATVEAAIRKAVGTGYTFGGLGSTDQLLASLQIGEIAFNLFGIFAAAAGGFIILNTFRTVVAERRHDIGMLRAVGATRGTVVGMFLVEATFQGILGTAVGIVLGYGLAVLTIKSMEEVVSRYLRLAMGPPVFTATTWVLAIGLGMVVTLVSALIPAMSAGRITPLEALRPALGSVYEAASRRRGLIGAVIIGISVALLATRQPDAVTGGSVIFVVGLSLAAPVLIRPMSDAIGRLFNVFMSREARLAKSNLQRNPGRSATTASAVMIALAVVVAMLGVFQSIFGGFMTYIDKAMGADFMFIPNNIVLAQGNVAAGPRLTSEISHVPGIDAVGTMRIAMAKVSGASVQVIGIDPKAYPKVADFMWQGGSDSSAVTSLDNGRQLIANAIYASQNGLSPGDLVMLETPKGTIGYRVAGVGSDYLNAKLATVYISQAELKKEFDVTTDIMLLATLKSGADSGSAKRALDRIVADYPAFRLYESKQWKAEQLVTFDQSMSMMYSLIGVLALPSLLALMNTLAMSVLARTREIGMLRAVGSTRTQVRRMVLAESLLLASIGTVFGLVAGVWLGYALVAALQGIFPMPYTFPTGGVVTAIVVGLVFGMLAAILPARSASRLDVVEALHYE